SVCSVDRQPTRIDEDNYYVTNHSQPYTLQVAADGAATETFNIHFGEFFSDSVLHSLVTPTHRVLDDGVGKQLLPVRFFNQLHRRDATFNALIRSILTAQQEKPYNRLRFEEQLTALLTYHLQQHHEIARIINDLPPV